MRTVQGAPCQTHILFVFPLFSSQLVSLAAGVARLKRFELYRFSALAHNAAARGREMLEKSLASKLFLLSGFHSNCDSLRKELPIFTPFVRTSLPLLWELFTVGLVFNWASKERAQGIIILNRCGNTMSVKSNCICHRG